MTNLEKVILLKKMFDDGQIPRLAQHEVNPGLSKDDRINYIYFTLPVSINFQRNSPAMWKSALATYNDPETNYLFYPERVVEMSREKVQEDLGKHRLGLQKNKHTDIWIALSKTLNQYYENNPANILKAGDNDVEKILKLILENKKQFPFLSGLKISNYWLYILTNFTDAVFKNMHLISVIPDTHVIKSSILLNLVDEKATPIQVVEAWQELLKDSEISPVEMHPVLWNWSRAGFKPEV